MYTCVFIHKSLYVCRDDLVTAVDVTFIWTHRVSKIIVGSLEKVPYPFYIGPLDWKKHKNATNEAVMFL